MQKSTLIFIVYFVNGDGSLYEWGRDEDGSVFFKILDSKWTFSWNSKLLS